MTRFKLPIGVLLVALTSALPGATPPSKTAAVELVKEGERSKHFLAVSRELELGGTLFAYADVDGDVMKFAQAFQTIMGQMAANDPKAPPFLKQDYPVLSALLGLDEVKALGLSSVPDGTGFFRNRIFLYIPGERHGLLAGLGGPPAPFVHLNLAPKDADVYGETELDVPAMYAAVKQVVEKASGPDAVKSMDDALAKAGQPVGFSALKLLESWRGTTTMVMRFDPEKSERFPVPPAGFVVPAFSLLIEVDHIAPAMEGLLAKSPFFTVRNDGKARIYELKQPSPVEQFQPVFGIDGTSFFFASSSAFLDECRHQSTNLGQSSDFQQALAHVGREGNSLGYVSPRFFSSLRQLAALNPDMPADSRRILDTVVNNLSVPNRPLISMRINLPDGILLRAYANRSLKQDVAAAAIYNPVTIGIMAAMAIPAFQKVRDASQEKAILNNLRQLSAAADQYYLENSVTTVTFDQLVGPDKYVRQVNSVAGENYRQIEFRQGEVLRVQLPSGKTVEYKP